MKNIAYYKAIGVMNEPIEYPIGGSSIDELLSGEGSNKNAFFDLALEAAWHYYYESGFHEAHLKHCAFPLEFAIYREPNSPELYRVVVGHNNDPQFYPVEIPQEFDDPVRRLKAMESACCCVPTEYLEQCGYDAVRRAGNDLKTVTTAIDLYFALRAVVDIADVMLAGNGTPESAAALVQAKIALMKAEGEV